MESLGLDDVTSTQSSLHRHLGDHLDGCGKIYNHLALWGGLDNGRTSLHTSTANSNSVPVYDSGEYS